MLKTGIYSMGIPKFDIDIAGRRRDAHGSMNMIMLDLMYAPTDWLTLMLMPQFVDMNMSTRELNGAPAATFDQQALINHHTLHEHTTGG
ncbi:MAG: hypothetical protein ACXWTT_10015, partial [Methylobacter sp.]